jgi:hypothetical protein
MVFLALSFGMATRFLENLFTPHLNLDKLYYL